MYSFKSRIRYSELDCEGKLSMASLLDYFQDCSTFQSEDAGVGIQYMKQIQQVWVVSSWQIVVERYPSLGEEVVIGTFPYDFKAFLGSRNFFMETTEGEVLARANSLWSLVDLTTGKPVAPSREMLEKYPLEEKLPMEYAPRKIAIPKEGEMKEPVVITQHHLDTNHHVNNGQFVNIAMSYLPENFEMSQLRAEYKKQAFLDDVLYPYVAVQDSGYVVNLGDIEGKTYVAVEFLRKEK